MEHGELNLLDVSVCVCLCTDMSGLCRARVVHELVRAQKRLLQKHTGCIKPTRLKEKQNLTQPRVCLLRTVVQTTADMVDTTPRIFKLRVAQASPFADEAARAIAAWTVLERPSKAQEF